MAPLPSKREILDYIRSSPNKIGKRELARAFNIRGDQRAELKRLLRDMADEGLIERGRRRKTLRDPSDLPAVTVLEIIDVDTDGELICRPAQWKSDKAAPEIMLAPGKGHGRQIRATLGIGDRVLARIKRTDDGYEASLIKTLGQSAHHILGVYRKGPHANEGRVEPVDRKSRHELVISAHDSGGATANDLVTVEVLDERRYGLKKARVREIHGKISDQRSVSLIAIHTHGIPTGFAEAELKEAAAAGPPGLDGRTDLRDLSLITIDPESARDFDDAVYAEPDGDPKNPKGWVIVVAIADVAHFVKPGSELDRGARERSNSVYFPDRVIAMLPEKLSNDLCSLKPNIERACLAVRMRFDKDGKKIGHTFMRGLMKSAARLTYQQAQAAMDGHPDQQTEMLLDATLKPLWSAYAALLKARKKRSPLELNLPENKIELAPDGSIKSIAFRHRLTAHELIEEFMIQANICAAEILESHRSPLIYRVHEPPPADKLDALRDFLKSLDINFTKGSIHRSGNFNDLLRKAKGTDYEDMIGEIVLRTQCQAVYSEKNLGHFGLNLKRYTHFTSPIRRYADLIVHRALIASQKLGDDGLTDEAAEQLSQTAELISTHERRALAAERDCVDRYLAAYLVDRIGATFKARISGVTRFGLFVKLADTGADGIVPMRSLTDDRYRHEAERHALVGLRHGGLYRLGQTVDVRLLEASPVKGALRFELLTDPTYGLKVSRRKQPSSGKKTRAKKRKKK